MPRVETRDPPICGNVAPGFEEVRVEFERNFHERGELGAACAIYHRGELLVDLWGGWLDAGCRKPWEKDTLVCVFSTTKGLAAMTLAVAHSRGLLDFEAPVASYWPEFAQQEKSSITVQQLLSHQGGLSAIDVPLDLRTIRDPDALANAVARQKPAWQPGTKHGYHGISLGWYEGELLRRIDPLHRRLGQFFRDEIARPLGLEFYIGVPDDVSDSRIAAIQDFPPLRMLFHLNKLPWRFVLSLMNPWSLASRSLMNPRLSRPADLGRGELRSLEMPAANGIGRVQSIARAYSEFATGGQMLGLHRDSLQAISANANQPLHGLMDQVFGIEMKYSLGFMKPFSSFRFGSSERAYGAPGMGGSFGFADPDAEVGFAYAPNRSGYFLWNDPREKSLRDTFYRCLARQKPMLPRNCSATSVLGQREDRISLAGTGSGDKKPPVLGICSEGDAFKDALIESRRR